MSGAFGTNWLDLSSTSNRYIQTYYKGFVDISGGPLYVRNNTLYVQAGDISLNGRLFGAGDVSLNSRLYVGSDVSLGGRLFVKGDVSMNGNVFVTTQISTDNSTKVATTAFVATALSSFTGGGGGGTSSNFTTDVSMNNRLIVLGDVSFNSRIYVGSDVSLGGNLFINNVFKPTTISESFVTNTGTTSPYTLNFLSGSTFYITTPPASNFTVNLTNVPVDINRTYVATLIIRSITNKTFCSSVQINGNSAITPNYAGGIPASITSGNVITQSISIQRITTGDIAANVILLTSLIAWY